MRKPRSTPKQQRQERRPAQVGRADPRDPASRRQQRRSPRQRLLLGRNPRKMSRRPRPGPQSRGAEERRKFASHVSFFLGGGGRGVPLSLGPSTSGRWANWASCGRCFGVPEVSPNLGRDTDLGRVPRRQLCRRGMLLSLHPLHQFESLSGAETMELLRQLRKGALLAYQSLEGPVVPVKARYGMSCVLVGRNRAHAGDGPSCDRSCR